MIIQCDFYGMENVLSKIEPCECLIVVQHGSIVYVAIDYNPETRKYEIAQIGELDFGWTFYNKNELKEVYNGQAREVIEKLFTVLKKYWKNVEVPTK